MTVTNDSAGRRFLFQDDDGTGELRYTIRGQRIILEHTEVAPALRGRGVAGSLAKAALEHARAEKLTVVPHCSYVRAYLTRHPEYQDLLEQPLRAQPPSGDVRE